MTPEPTPRTTAARRVNHLDPSLPRYVVPVELAEDLERELAAAKAELDRLKAALVKLKPYTECACPEDPETGRVSYHFNCARSGRKIIDEALKP